MKKLAVFTSVTAIVAVAIVGGWLVSSASGITSMSNTPIYSGPGLLQVPSAISVPVYGTGSSNGVTLKSPAWSPIPESAGSVTTPGDLALIDANHANGLHLSVFVTNLSQLQRDYSSFALPVGVYYLGTTPSPGASPYRGSSACNIGTCSWQLANGAGSAPDVSSTLSYLTSDTGMVSFNLPPGYYDVTLQAGGSFYCTTTAAGALSPSFFISAKSA